MNPISNADFEYHYCVGAFMSEALSKMQIEQLMEITSNLHIDTNNIFIEEDYFNINRNGFGDYSSEIKVLSYLAELVQNATGIVECLFSSELGSPVTHLYSIRDGKLYREATNVLRTHLEVVEAIEDGDWQGIDGIAYKGKLCMPLLTTDQEEAISSFLETKKQYFKLEDKCIKFNYQANREYGRWYIKSLLELTQFLDPNIKLEGEIECHIDTENSEAFYEFYSIHKGRLLRQKGNIQKGMPVEVRFG